MAGAIPPAQPPPGRLRHPPPWRLRHNPLRRRTDVVQAWLSLAVLLAVAVGAPAALVAVADAAHGHFRGVAERQAETRHRTTAVLVHDAPRHPEPGSDEERAARYRVEVRYTDRSGTVRTAEAEVRPALSAGSRVPVWVDADGGLTGPPPTAGEIRSRAMGWAILAALAVALTGATVHRVAGMLIHRRNLAAWDTAWAETAPRWTTSP